MIRIAAADVYKRQGLGRAMAGESIFLTTYTAGNDNSEIAFGSSFPGKILPITLCDGECIIIQKTAFLAAEDSVTLQPFFRKRLGAGFFGGEGFILQKLIGPGTAFLEIDGDIVEKELQPGQLLKIDPVSYTHLDVYKRQFHMCLMM